MTENKNIIIYKTNDYSQFKMIHINRDVNKSLVAKLKANIEKKNLLIDRPILVDKAMQVLDGQHRFEAAQELGLDIHYVIAEATEIKDIPSLQLSRNWNNYDYLKMFVKEGNENYIKLDKFLKEYDVPTINLGLALLKKSTIAIDARDGCMSISGIGGGVSSIFNAGNFKYPGDDSKARSIISKIKDIATRTDYKLSGSLYGALFIIVTEDKYNHESMLEKLNIVAAKVRPANSVKLWVNEFESVYNYKLNRKNQIRFARAA